MAVIERDIILMSKVVNGNQTIDLPVTNLRNIEGTADVKDTLAVGDYVPILDSADNGQMKKMLASVLFSGVKFNSSNVQRPGSTTTVENSLQSLETEISSLKQQLSNLTNGDEVSY